MTNEYYKNDGASKTIETGNYKGYEWKIRTNWGRYPSAYVALPESHHFYRTMYDDIHANLHVHGGLTYGDGFPWIGWDYGHMNDYNPATEIDGHVWSRDEIYAEITACIDALIEDEEASREIEEYEMQWKKEWKEKRDVICHPSRGREIYRAVGESVRDWHPCYECGHMEVIRDVSPWFLDKACAEAMSEYRRMLNSKQDSHGRGLSYVWLDEDGDACTSQRCSAPKEDVVRLLKLWKHKQNIVGDKAGVYTVVENTDESVKIGCHVIPTWNIELLCNALKIA